MVRLWAWLVGWLRERRRPERSHVFEVRLTDSGQVVARANRRRAGLILFNDTNTRIYVKLGGRASLESFTLTLLAQERYEVPFDYCGVVEAFWVAPNGRGLGCLRVTELF